MAPRAPRAGVPPALLLGTNKTISCFGSLPALFRYRRARLLPSLPVREWAVLMLTCALGAVGGAALSQVQAFLDRLAAIVPLLLGLVMAFMIKRWFWDEKRRGASATLGTKDEEMIVHLRARIGPVLAPLGTAARLTVPSSSSTSTSTVGFPRESRISRAPTASMADMVSPEHSWVVAVVQPSVLA